MIVQTAAMIAALTTFALSPAGARMATASERSSSAAQATRAADSPRAAVANPIRLSFKIDGVSTEVGVTGANLGGLNVEASGGPGAASRRLRIAWDVIDPDVALRIAAEHSVPVEWASDLWRARMRLERGDWPGAEPIVERAMAVLEFKLARAGGTDGESPSELTVGPTQAMVAESAISCRLNRGAHASALRAYFVWLSAASASPTGWAGSVSSGAVVKSDAAGAEWVGGVVSLPGVIDDRWGLCPDLPPIFFPEPAMVALAQQDWSSLESIGGTATGRSQASELIGWYLTAIRFEVGQSGGDAAQAQPASSAAEIVRGPAAGAGLSGSARLVRDIVVARTASGADRSGARAALTARLEREDTPPWVEAWCRAGIGRSLVAEQDPALVRVGVIELLHVPARFSRQTPYLAAVCLAESANAMQRLGDQESSDILRAELAKRFPGHSALSWSSHATSEGGK